MQLGAVLAGEGHVGQHVVLALVHELGQLRPAGAQLVGDAAPGLAGIVAVGLVEGLADRGGDDGVLAARDVGQGVAHPVHAAPLPSRLEDALDGRLEAAVGVGDHQLDAVEATRLQAAQEVRPEGLGLRRSDAQADDLPAALGVGGDGDYGRDR